METKFLFRDTIVNNFEMNSFSTDKNYSEIQFYKEFHFLGKYFQVFFSHEN